MSIFNIAYSWYQFIHGDDQVKDMMFKRLKICDTCPEKQPLDKLGKLLVSTLSRDAVMYKCGKCNCPLSGKTAGPGNACPLGKWKEAGAESYFD